MAIDISGLLNKRENEGSTDEGRLTAKEWNTLVQAVEENQRAVNGAMKGVNFNGTEYRDVKDGILHMTVLGDTGRNIKFEWLQSPPETISKGGSCVVEFNVIDQQKDENDASQLIPYDQPGKVNFYVDEKLVSTVSGVYDPKYSKYTGPVSLDFSKVTTLSTKNDGNTLKIEYVNSGAVISKYFTVYVLDLSISVDNFNTVYTTDSKQNIKVTVIGAECKLYASIDDKTPYMIDGELIRPNIPFSITNQFDNYNTHGIHVLKIWAEPIDYKGVSTDVLTYNYIFGNTSDKTPIVMTTITEGSEFELYGKMHVNYVAFVSGENGNKDINIDILDDKNYSYLNTKQSVSFVNGIGSNSFTFTLFPNGTDILVGDRRLVINIKDADGNDHSHSTDIKIIESTTELTQAEGYAVYLSSNGRSNTEAPDTKRIWRSKSDDGKNTIVDVTFDDDIEFLDTGSGWCYDGIKTDPNDPNDKGTVAMHLKKGKGFTLNYAPFATNPAYNSGENNGTGNGLTISIEFATRNCLKSDAKVIECMDYTQEATGRGFYVTASDMKLVANDIELKSKFKEDTRIKLDLVIEGKLTKYYYDTVVGTDPSASDYIQQGNSDECLALVFVDGVYNGITLIKKSTSFQQGSSTVDPQFIRFGSDDCDLDVYNIRIYNRALTMNEIVKNYSYDTPVFADKIAIAQRNDIFSSAKNNMPTIDVGKLRKARPDLPFFYVTLDPTHADKLPQNKSDWKKLTMTAFQNPNATGKDATVPKASFESVTGVLRNQGTSSMTYPWPWRNWDWKTGDSDFGDKSTFKYYFPDMNSDESGSKWHQLDYTGDGDALPIKKITLKKDYASSEMCNNAICSDIFTDMALGIATSYKGAVSPAMRMDIEDETKKHTNFKLALKAMPCFMFHRLENPNAEGSAGIGLDGMGMMNLIPNKNEVGYLGFKKNKWENAKDGSEEREQSWELCDNLDDIFWVKKLDHFRRNADGTFINMVKDHYEARTPKDSCVDWGGSEADFGMTPKDMVEIEYTQAEAVRDEQYDIVEFHNWLVDTNQSLATNEPLKGSRENWNDDGTGKAKYTIDTKEYRKAKFAAEAKDRLLLDQWILYYIWREQFWMFDSGFKNLQVYTVGPNPENPGSAVMQWGCMVRDADTGLGIENTGKDYFPPHIEDIDYYTESNGKITFHYGKAAGIYDITELEKTYGNTAKAVLNGQFGSIWVNLRECFSTKIGEMYRALCNNAAVTNFGADAAIKKFRSHQEHWCENLYNFGMRQYFGGSPFSYFNKSALGDKKNSRAQWLERGFYYRRGKYRNLADNSAFRINTYESPDEVTKELRVKSYIPMYIGVGGTTAEMINSKNVIRLVDDTYEDGSIGKPISTGETGFNFPNTGDAVSYIYGTSMLTDIGDLARVCKLLRVQTMSFPKLRELNLGHERTRTSVCGIPCEQGPYMEYATKYIKDPVSGEMIVDPDAPLGEPREFKNEILPNLDCSSLSHLTILDVTNHTNLSELVIDKCTQLQELYARGTIMKSIDLPATTSLKKIYLGEKLTSLSLVDLTGIEEFVIEGLSDCGRLVINNCGDYMGKESYNILNKAIIKLESSYDYVTNPNVVSLRGVNWENADQTMLERLLKINADLTGKIIIKALSNDLKIKLIEKYGNIDDPNNSLYIKYNQTAITKITLPKKLYIYTEGEHPVSFSVTPNNANTYKSATWSLTPNKFATINAETGVITRNNEEADELTMATLSVTVKQMPDTDGEERANLTAECSVYFYERIAKVGDIVFNDGTYSDELESGKTPIGVCFYIDPLDKNKRLMCALNKLRLNNSDYIEWGTTRGDSGENINGTTYYWGTSPNLSIEDSDYDCYNIVSISDFINSGTDKDVSDTSYNFFSDEFFRDSTNPENDYFKKFEKTTHYGDLGWKTALQSIKVDGITTADGKKSISISENDNVPSGYYNTLAIIAHRNKILDEYKNTKDQDGAFIRPYTIEGEMSEYYTLEQLTEKADHWSYEERDGKLNNTYGSHLYFPAASACFAYEPNANNLINKFKKYNWFLPSSGDVARICYYGYHSLTSAGVPTENPTTSQYDDSYNAPANAFANAMKLDVLYKGFKNTSYFYSSTEVDANDAVAIYSSVNSHGGIGRAQSFYKASGASIIPVCVF